MRGWLRSRLSSRWRLNLSVLAALVIVLMIGGFIAVQIVSSRFVSRIDDDLHESARGMTFAYELLGPEVFDELAQLDLSSSVLDSNEAMLIVGPDGVEFAFPAGSTDDPEPLPDIDTGDIEALRRSAWDTFEVGNVEGGSPRYRAITAPLGDGNVAVVASSLQTVHDAVKTVFWVLLVVGSTVAAALMIIISWISRRSIRPVEQMIITAQSIGGGELDTRLDLDSHNPDVTRLAGALNSMLERLQQAFGDKEQSERRLRQFVADASHELRTPLSAILGYTELYHHDISRSPEQVNHAMNRINVEGTRMQSLVEELLLLARLDQQAPVLREPVDVGDLVRDAVQRAETVDTSHPVTVAVDDEPLVVHGNDAQLSQALDNLLTNAQTHTSDGTHINIAAERNNSHIVVTVADNGPGMSDEDATRAFDRFYRVERSRARPGGTGLGLSIVRAVVETHGGSIDLQTTPGDGATFTITLPAEDTGPGETRSSDPTGMTEPYKPRTADQS